MSNSRNNQKYKNSKLADSSEDSAPDSPAIKVKNRENKDNPDPLYYHPGAHPTLATFFKRKSKELDKELRASAELKVSDDMTHENVSEKKAGI